MVKKIAFMNSRGGVGKSTSVFQIAGVLEDMGKKVLVIDLDKQRNSTDLLLANNEDYVEGENTFYDVISKGLKLKDVVKNSKIVGYGKRKATNSNIDVIPSDVRLQDISDIEIQSKFVDDYYEFQKNYDYVLIDMPPSNYYINSLCFGVLVDNIVVPLSCDIASVSGYGDLLETVSNEQEINPNLQIAGLYFSRFNKCSKMDRDLEEAIENGFSGALLKNIPLSEKVKKSGVECRPLSHSVNKKNVVLNAYIELTKQLIAKCK